MVLEVPHKEVHQAAHGRLAHRLDPGEEEFENSLMTHDAGLFDYKEHGLKKYHFGMDRRLFQFLFDSCRVRLSLTAKRSRA